MDKLEREALVLRNRAMADAFHRTPTRHYLRRGLLRLAARLPRRVARRHSGRVLLIRPDHLGDTLLTVPAIRALKAAQPHLELHALVGGWSSQVLANVDEVDQVLTLPFPGFSRSPNASLGSPYRLALTTAARLRRIGYDSAVIFRPDHWWGALVAHRAGIPHIIGYDLPDVAPFLTDPVPMAEGHVVEQNLRLVQHWTGTIPARGVRLSFRFDTLDDDYIRGYLDEWGIAEGEPYFCIHPGAGTWVKRWDEANWATVADTLAEQLSARVILTGSDQELPLVYAIAQQMQSSACLMAGDTSVSQLAALFSRARVVLGPDSGPLHLAVAVGAPTVTLYGPARLSDFAPWGDPRRHIALTSDIGCLGCGVLDWGSDAPENHPCIREISVGEVLSAARLVAQGGV